MQLSLFILSIVILITYTSSISNEKGVNSKYSRAYCLASQIAFLAPVVCQLVSFFLEGPIWTTASNLISALCFIGLLFTQNGFGIIQWRPKRNKLIAIAMIVALFAAIQITSNPPYLNAFLTILTLSILIHLQDKRNFKLQKTSLESVKSKLLSLDSKRHNDKFFQNHGHNHNHDKIRKI